MIPCSYCTHTLHSYSVLMYLYYCTYTTISIHCTQTCTQTLHAYIALIHCTHTLYSFYRTHLLTAEIPVFSPIWVKNVKPLQFFITPAKLLSPFRGQLAVDLLWAPEPLNGATGPNTGLDRPTSRGCLLAVYWQFAREPQGRNFGPRESIPQPLDCRVTCQSMRFRARSCMQNAACSQVTFSLLPRYKNHSAGTPPPPLLQLQGYFLAAPGQK
jgi:hypothetical protein